MENPSGSSETLFFGFVKDLLSYRQGLRKKGNPEPLNPEPLNP